MLQRLLVCEHSEYAINSTFKRVCSKKRNVFLCGTFCYDGFQYFRMRMEQRISYANLNDGSKIMGGKRFHTVRALLISDNVFDFKRLLQNGALKLFLNNSLNLYPSRWKHVSQRTFQAKMAYLQ